MSHDTVKKRQNRQTKNQKVYDKTNYQKTHEGEGHTFSDAMRVRHRFNKGTSPNFVSNVERN